MDFDLGARASALRTRLRELIATHVAEGSLGAFTDDPADLDAAPRVCRSLADEGLPTVAWHVGPPRAPRRPVHGAQLGGAGDHGLRHWVGEGARHEGITMFLVPMGAAGIQARSR